MYEVKLKSKHRGPHPKDKQLFSKSKLVILKKSVYDINWMLSRGYPEKASLKLVCDRYRLVARQRSAVQKAACSDSNYDLRKQKKIKLSNAGSSEIWIDGFNLIITIETAVSRGIIIACRDEACRDLSGVHGTYKRITETSNIIRMAGDYIAENYKGNIVWLLDKPVSNSGRLKKLILEIAGENDWRWKVDLVLNPDRELESIEYPVVTSDSIILSRCGSWINLAREIIEDRIPEAWVVDFS